MASQCLPKTEVAGTNGRVSELWVHSSMIIVGARMNGLDKNESGTDGCIDNFTMQTHIYVNE